MSCSDNYIVPGANPMNQAGGVESVGAGTPNVTITGTPIHPLVNVTNVGGVTQVEGQIGNVNFNGIGITVAGGVPVLGDVTLTAAVQNITGSNAAIITQPTPGTFNVNVPSALVNNITEGAGINITNPSAGVFNIASIVQNVTAGGGVAVTNPTPGTYQVASVVQNVTGGAGVSVTNPTPGTYQINPAVQNITGSGNALVSQSTPGTFNVNVPFVNVGVTSIKSVSDVAGISGAVNFQAIGPNLTITTSGAPPSTMLFAVDSVTRINPGGAADIVTLASSDNSVAITAGSPGTINFAVAPPTPAPTGSPNIIVASNVISLGYNTTTAGQLSVQGPVGIGYTIAAGTTAGFRIIPGEALIFALLTQKTINPTRGFLCISVNIGMRTLLNANTNAGARLNVYLKPYNQGIGTSAQDMILATTNYQAGFESTVYCNFFLGSFQAPLANILPNLDVNNPFLSLYIENQFTTDIRLNYVGDNGWGYITDNLRSL